MYLLLDIQRLKNKLEDDYCKRAFDFTKGFDHRILFNSEFL